MQTTTTEPTPIMIEANGKTFSLRPLGLNDVCELESMLNATMTEIIVAIASGSARHARALIWAALQKDQPAMTLEDAGRFIQDVGGLAAVSGVLTKVAKSHGTAAPAAVTRRKRRA